MMGVTSTIPPSGGISLLKRFRYGSHTFASTLLMSAKMPRSVGSHYMSTYTNSSML